MTPEDLERWATHAVDSPLYIHLVRVIAEDADLLRILGQIEHTPKPNVLFAAVQYLMARNPGSSLATFYPNFVAEPLPSDEIGPEFRSFVLDHESEIIEIGATRYTQTNECRRCVALLPLVWEAPFDAFHLVDVGASAGLNLAIDRYKYQWGDLEWGPDSPLLLTTELRGIAPDPRPIEVLSRTGLDLNPLDPTDADARLWLESLVWPEHDDRRARLLSALRLVGELPITLVAGDALVTLPDVLAGLPVGEPVVVMTSFTLLQFSLEAREEFEEIIQRNRAARQIHRVSMELGPERTSSAMLTVDDGTGRRWVGDGHHHGAWIDLYARP